jgi:Ca2+-binding RTX toxin-like protein
MGPGKRTWVLALLAGVVASLAVAPGVQAKLIVGNSKANKLVGTGKRDDIHGRFGADVLVGLRGADRLHGEEGPDILLGETGNDRLWGLGRDDTLDGGPGADRIWPGNGGDVVEAGPGDDIVRAGDDDGRIDSVDCGPGFDCAVVNRRDQVFNCERVTRRPGAWVRGRLWVDWNDANHWNQMDGHFRDLLVGLTGNDSLNGFAFPDIIWGNEDDDDLYGNSGPDFLLGGPGHDELLGEGGDDRLWGGTGLDHLAGGENHDQLFSVAKDREVDVVDCGPGRDRAIARPNDVVLNCERVIRISR